MVFTQKNVNEERFKEKFYIFGEKMGEEKSSKEKAPAGLTSRALLAVIILTIIFTFINAHGYQVTGTALFYNRWPYEYGQWPKPKD